MVIRRDERITRLALGSANSGGRLKSGDDAPQLVEAIAITAIDPDPDQPRRHFDQDELRELGESLRSVGQLQPIIVIRTGERYRLFVGERRWRAAALAGLTTIRALVRATPLEAGAARIAQIIENEQRADLTVSEMVAAVRLLLAEGLKSVEIAEALAKPRSRISELAALGDAPPELLAIVDRIGLGLGYQLLRQWRAHPDAALDFLAHMPVEHISRVTIATLAQPASPDGAGAQDTARLPLAEPPDLADRKEQGEEASPRSPVPASRTTTLKEGEGRAPGAARVAPAPAMIGALLVEHPERGAGRVVFGADVAADHLAIRFADGAPVVLHKSDLKLTGTIPSDADHG